MKKNNRKFLNELRISFGQFTTETFTGSLKKFEHIFTPAALLMHFQPDGIISLEGFDHLLAINYKQQLCGYYKVSIFDFSNEIELHAGISLNSPFLNRSYFQLTKQFVTAIAEQFPTYDISVWVDPQNSKIKPLLQFVGFKKSELKMQGLNYENYRFRTNN
jgi:hypothetical protein